MSPKGRNPKPAALKWMGITLWLILSWRPTVMAQSAAVTCAPPPPGKLYHGVYPGQNTGREDEFTLAELRSYEQLAGRPAAWVYFSNEWRRSRAFPAAMAAWIRQAGSVPFIRLMLRSSDENHYREQRFTLQHIIDGKFDDDLKAWGKGAAAFGTPVIVEYGTEANGDWFSWNGRWNGGGRTNGFGDPRLPDGPERFVAAYRHIVQVIRAAGARNLTWVFHVDVSDSPAVQWNRFENYFPGNDVVDWVGISCYGLQTPMEKEPPKSFRERLDPVYPRLAAMAGDKPIMVCEFGATAGHPKQKPEVWAESGLNDLLERRWPAIAGFAWWNEGWENDGHPQHNTTMRLQDIPELQKVFAREFQVHAGRIQDRLVMANPDAGK